MKKRRIISLLLCLSLFCGLLWTPAGAGFSDVPDSHWASRAIEEWSGYGVINGYDGKFRPDDAVTRAEIAVMLNNLLAYSDLAPNSFLDLENSWYTEAILKANAAGVMLGNEGRVRATDTVTREEAFCLFARALDILPIPGGKLDFTDAKLIGDWAKDTVYAMVKAGYVHGNDGKLRPRDSLTRAEAVTVLDQMVALVITDAGEYTGRVDGQVVINSAAGATLRDLEVFGDVILSDSVSVKSVKFYSVNVHGDIVYRVSKEDGDVTLYERDSGDSVVQNGKIVYGGRKLDIFKNVPKNTLKDSYFSTKPNGTVTYSAPGAVSLQGIDVSSWQRDIDWTRVAKSGIAFAILRVGYRGYERGKLNEDSYFAKNIEGASKAGLGVGLYFFSQAITPAEAEDEARFVLARIGGYHIAYPIVFDWEDVSDPDARTAKLPNKTLTACAQAFCRVIEEAGYTPAVYFGTAKGLLNYDLSALANYDFWYARYGSTTPRFYYAFSIWQYSATAGVDGIAGYVDRNICFKRYL